MTTTRLTKVEILDEQYPGLANDAQTWFAQGIPARYVAELLAEKYGVALTASPVASYRARRWAPAQRQLRQTSAALQTALDSVQTALDAAQALLTMALRNSGNFDSGSRGRV